MGILGMFGFIFVKSIKQIKKQQIPPPQKKKIDYFH